MHDLLVKLYDLPPTAELYREVESKEIRIVRVLAPDIEKVVAFARTFREGWASECIAACSNHPISCFIAVKNHELVGFACYDATCRNFFGPTGVSEKERHQHIGEALMLKCFEAMAADGYGYAIVGSVKEALEFYVKTVNAQIIEDSDPGVYGRMISYGPNV